MAEVTIGFVPRERFCLAADALERIYLNTRLDFRLIIVDCGIPDIYRRQMDEVLAGRENFEFIRTDQFVQSHAAYNLVIERNKQQFLCLIENDNLVHEDWLHHLLAACTEHPADAAVPLIFERTEDKIHFDDRLGSIRSFESEGKRRLAIVPRASSPENDRTEARRSIELIETHCILFRSEVFRRIGKFDQQISQSRNEVDLSLTLYHAGVRCALEPRARVTFFPPPPIYPEERDYYLFKWDVERARRSEARIKEKWNLAGLPTSVPFVEERRRLADEVEPAVQLRREFEYRSNLADVTSEIAALVPAGDAIILVDDVCWNANEVAAGRHAIPFLERNGEYWGCPADDATAIREFERLRQQARPSCIVFGWPAFWWLDYYTGLHDHLRARFPCVLENDRLVAFNLRSDGQPVE